jgi:carboxyl-terminal processing protease
MKNIYFKSVIIVVVISVCMIASFGSGMYLSQRNNVIKNLAQEEVVYLGKLTGKYSQPKAGILSQDVDFKLFWDVWDNLKKNYVDREKINDKKLFYGAIKGMVSAVGDPYTVFMDPKISKDFHDDLAGTFEGIGAEIGMKGDALTIIAPLPDMPAEKAGLKASDKILAINGISTNGLSVDEAVNRIRGEKNTKVKLIIMRGGFEAPKEFEVTRGMIIVKSVRKEFRPDGIYVLKITNFNDDTLDLFNEAVSDITAKNPKGIVLDMRNDPGGYLETAIEVASRWIEDGPVVIEQFSPENKNEYLARGRARLENFKTAVLINQGSASASEIVAGALQDTGKGTLIGMKSFGKGSVQSLETMPDGSSLKVTVAKWLTPKGTSINEHGITPDFGVDFTAEDYNKDRDPQLDTAVKFLEGKLSKSEIDVLRKAATASSTLSKATSTSDQ